jgi:hypothetical protein
MIRASVALKLCGFLYIITFIGTFGVVLRPFSFFTLLGLMLTAVWQIIVGAKLYKLD